MTGRKKALIAGAVLAAMLIPIPYIASPEWTVTVTDEAGRPLSGMQVSLSYENYSVEDTSHEIDLTTGDDGRVSFPANMEFASLLSRCYYTARSASAVAHASFGSSAFITVFGNGREGSVNSADGTAYSWAGRPNRVTSVVVGDHWIIDSDSILQSPSPADPSSPHGDG